MADAGRFMTKWEMVGGTGTWIGFGGGPFEFLETLAGLTTAWSPRFEASSTRSAALQMKAWPS